MTLRPGDTIELAIWLSGSETPEHIRSFMADDAKTALDAKAKAERVSIADPEFTAKLPGDDRVPPVPPWLEQKVISLGRKPVTLSLVQGREPKTYVAPVLLVAGAMVLGPKQSLQQKGFLADLSPSDLADLRKRTREVWDKSRVGWRTLTDQECDKLIDEHGPDAAVSAVMGAHHAGPVH